MKCDEHFETRKTGTQWRVIHLVYIQSLLQRTTPFSSAQKGNDARVENGVRKACGPLWFVTRLI